MRNEALCVSEDERYITGQSHVFLTWPAAVDPISTHTNRM